MDNKLKITIVTPGSQPLVFEGTGLITSTIDGRIEFKSNHAPIIISTVPATTTILTDNGNEILFTSSGIVYIKNNELKFCCDAAEKSLDIDEARAVSAKERAEKRLEQGKDVDVERAKRALARANARINTISIND